MPRCVGSPPSSSAVGVHRSWARGNTQLQQHLEVKVHLLVVRCTQSLEQVTLTLVFFLADGLMLVMHACGIHSVSRWCIYVVASVASGYYIDSVGCCC